jgi:hypothetical protein
MDDMLAKLKKVDSDLKRKFMLEHINSKNAQSRSMAESFKKSLDNDTSMMLETGSRTGQRIDASGKAYGPQMEKADSGRYEKEKDPVKKAKGGSVGSASKRADGIAQRGKTKGRFV